MRKAKREGVSWGCEAEGHEEEQGSGRGARHGGADGLEVPAQERVRAVAEEGAG
jgi:hypothetical protein